MSRSKRLACRSRTRSCGAALHRSDSIAARALTLVVLFGSAVCRPAGEPSSDRDPTAEKWYQRAHREFRTAVIDAAQDSVGQALARVPDDPEVRVLAARIALARLEFAEVLRLLRDIPGSEASSLRGRAHWYKGDLQQAADELDQLLTDPDVVDPWAKAITKLARRGLDRKPFAVSGGILAAVELPRTDGAPFYVVPLEIDGSEAFALVATRNAEVVLDSATRQEPSWVSLRFGQRLEVRDVPALTQDLSEVSRQLGGAPIKALLGANVLRHLNATLDFRGRQFVVRTFVPPPPPVASRVDLYYLRGGGMITSSLLDSGDAARASLFIDTAMGFSVALDDGGWGKIGVDVAALTAGPDSTRSGSIPLLHFGAFKLPQIPGIYGESLEQVEKEMNIDVDGVLGAGFLSSFRLTFSDGGRVLWVEQAPSLADLPLPGGELGPGGGPGPGDAPALGTPPGGGFPGPAGTPRTPGMGTDDPSTGPQP